MVDSDEGGPRLSIHAREVLRLLRMAGAAPNAGVRLGLLRNMWARHVPRAEEEGLTVAIGELQNAGLVLRGVPDSVVPTAQALAIR